MGYKVFEISGASDDEVNHVYKLLDKHSIAYYDTPHGNIMMSSAAIWVDDIKSYKKSRRLIDEYQTKRSRRIRARYRNSQKKKTSEKAYFGMSGVTFFGIFGLVVSVLFLLTLYRIFN